MNLFRELPTPRLVKDLLSISVHTHKEYTQQTNPTTAVWVITGRDRTGLLAFILSHIACYSETFQVEDVTISLLKDTVYHMATVVLLIRCHHPENVLSWQLMAGDIEYLQALDRKLEGWNVSSAQTVTLTVEGPDWPYQLKDICQILATQQANITSLVMKPSTKFADNPDGSPRSQGQQCNYTFTLHLPGNEEERANRLQQAIMSINALNHGLMIGVQ